MSGPAPGSWDPITRMAFQPIVDATGLVPRRAALTTANLFLATATTLSAVRAATLDWTATPGLAATLAMAMTGAGIMYAVMRFGVVAGSGMLTGPIGAMHLGVRLLFLYCVVADIVQVATLLTADDGVGTTSLFRALLQLAQSVEGFASLHLALCTEPPPPPPGRRQPSYA